MDDTIFALASGRGRSGVAVFRISGSKSADIFERLTGEILPEARFAKRVTLREPESGDLLDDGLALWFPAPHSYTGEDVLELHTHGGRAVRDAIGEVLTREIRSAAPGEFTRRAFEHDKMDLTAAEGVADLVDAETAAQRRQALRQMRGELGAIYEGWRQRLVTAMAKFEAEIDFSDEELPEGLIDQVKRDVADLADEIAAHLDDHHRGEILREGVYVAIVGPPNAGKSSLLNWLAKRDVAIVSAIAGTTRDVIETRLDLNGFPVTVADTAGLRESSDEIELEGVRRAHRQAASSDLKITVFDGDNLPHLDETTLSLVDENAIPVINKSDLVDVEVPTEIAGRELIAISALKGDGLEELLARLGDEVVGRCDIGETASITRLRHRAALETGVIALRRFDGAEAVELAAEDLRIGATALGQITGRVDVEDLLDVIFREFCIGK